jgi:hypothetical protein
MIVRLWRASKRLTLRIDLEQKRRYHDGMKELHCRRLGF